MIDLLFEYVIINWLPHPYYDDFVQQVEQYSRVFFIDGDLSLSYTIPFKALLYCKHTPTLFTYPQKILFSPVLSIKNRFPRY